MLDKSSDSTWLNKHTIDKYKQNYTPPYTIDFSKINLATLIISQKQLGLFMQPEWQ